MTDLPEEEDFRQEVLAFLGAVLPPKGATTDGDGEKSGVARAVAYQGALAEAGLAGITWPVEYGGRGLPGRFQRIFDREAKAFRVPPRALEIGLGMCGPTLLVHASEEQKHALIPPLLRGEHVWCELFSEPGAGSDLSSVQTRARLDGSEFVVDGQKVWTSGAQHSDFAACLTRTDPERPKREGITMLIVDMHAPGITVRPLRQMTGDAHFNEVFLEGVRVPAANVLGDVHTAGAWRGRCWPSSAWRWAAWAREVAARVASPRWRPRQSGATSRPAPYSATAWSSCASARWCCGISADTSGPRRGRGTPRRRRC